MATIEEILAIINNNPKQLADMSDEELEVALKDCITLEPKPLPKPLAQQVLDELKAEDEDDDDNPIKLNRPKKSKREKVKDALSDFDRQIKELEGL